MLKESTELSMISVQNHQQPLSGNKRLYAYAVAITLLLGACSPKTRVLRSPDLNAGNVGNTSPKTEQPEEAGDVKATTNMAARKAEAARNSIALVLPFQLDRISAANLSKEDIDRSSIALDFYQGFQLGLDELAEKGRSFSLQVVDSRNNEQYTQAIATSDELQGAALVVGPVFPKEISAFGTGFANKNVLQINPLAASRPQEFSLPNLVSLTPSIDAHREALAKRVADDYRQGDLVLIYNTNDDNSRQLLNGFETELKRQRPDLEVRVVTTIEELNEQMHVTGTNRIVAGTTDKFQLRAFISNLETKSLEELCTFRVYGHPLWDRIDFSIYKEFANFQPVITAESHLAANTKVARDFIDSYASLYGIAPSDHAYKGYDAARYFGNLLAKYGDSYKDHITETTFEGLFSNYQFDYHDGWGFLNNAISFKRYKGTSFQQQ